MGATVVTGVPGVGKSTVMEAAARAAGLKIVVYGTEMLQIAKERGLVEHRDEMRRLDAAVQRDVQIAAAAAIAKMGDVIVDTHASIQTPQGFLPGLPAWVLETLKPDSFILVEADPEEISTRRTGDASRQRDADSAESIARHQGLNRAFVAAYATITGATVAIVENRQGKVEEAVEAVLPVVRRNGTS